MFLFQVVLFVSLFSSTQFIAASAIGDETKKFFLSVFQIEEVA